MIEGLGMRRRRPKRGRRGERLAMPAATLSTHRRSLDYAHDQLGDDRCLRGRMKLLGVDLMGAQHYRRSQSIAPLPLASSSMSHANVTYEAVAPWLRRHARLVAAARIALGVCLLAGSSHLRLPFVHTPVPFTLQPQAVLLVAAMLGAHEGLGAVAAWLALGASGAPVFASALPGTWALMGPTGGYLASYLPVAYGVGRFGRGYGLGAAATWLAGAALTLGLGAAWLSHFVGASAAWALGVLPFAAADLYKLSAVFIARHLAHIAWRRPH